VLATDARLARPFPGRMIPGHTIPSDPNPLEGLSGCSVRLDHEIFDRRSRPSTETAMVEIGVSGERRKVEFLAMTAPRSSTSVLATVTRPYSSGWERYSLLGRASMNGTA
jgi:hypothetical protein